MDRLQILIPRSATAPQALERQTRTGPGSSSASVAQSLPPQAHAQNCGSAYPSSRSETPAASEQSIQLHAFSHSYRMEAAGTGEASRLPRTRSAPILGGRGATPRGSTSTASGAQESIANLRERLDLAQSGRSSRPSQALSPSTGRSRSEVSSPPRHLDANQTPSLDRSIGGKRSGNGAKRWMSAGLDNLRSALRAGGVRVWELPAWIKAIVGHTALEIRGDQAKRRVMEAGYETLRDQGHRIIVNPKVEETVEGGKSVRKLTSTCMVRLPVELDDPSRSVLGRLEVSEILTWDHKGESEVLTTESLTTSDGKNKLFGNVNPWTGEDYQPVMANMTLKEDPPISLSTTDEHGQEVLIQPGDKVVYTVLPHQQIEANAGPDGLVKLRALADKKKAYQQTKRLFSNGTSQRRSPRVKACVNIQIFAWHLLLFQD